MHISKNAENVDFQFFNKNENLFQAISLYPM